MNLYPGGYPRVTSSVGFKYTLGRQTIGLIESAMLWMHTPCGGYIEHFVLDVLESWELAHKLVICWRGIVLSEQKSIPEKGHLFTNDYEVSYIISDSINQSINHTFAHSINSNISNGKTQ